MANCFDLLDKKTATLVKKDAIKLAQDHGGLNGAYSFNADQEIAKLKATKAQILAEAKKETPKPVEKQIEPENKVYSLADYSTFFDEVDQGNVTAEQYKEEFEKVAANKDILKTELSKMTKDALVKAYPYAGLRFKNDPKPELVGAIFRDLMSNFNMSGTLAYGMGKGAMEEALRAKVDNITNEDLAKHAEQRKKSIAENEAFKAEVEKGMENPQTLDDYTRVLRSYIKQGDTFKEAFFKLTPDQRETYDVLFGETTRGDRKARADQQKTDVRATVTTTSGDIIETKHTKTGEDLFVVKAADRVERETYNEWNTTAKRLGGWYSSFKGAGAVPGFQFKTKDNAEAFLKYLGGDVTEAKEAVQARRDAYADDKSQSAAERLTEMADRLEEKADDELGRSRKANTAKRARETASAIAAAERSKALAVTMRNIAGAIESGKTKFLDRVRQKVQVEYLHGLVNTTQYTVLRDKYSKSYNDYLNHQHDPATKETADSVKMPDYSLYRSELANLGRKLIETDGTKKYGQAILKEADDVTDIYLKFAKENLDKVMVFRFKDGAKATFKLKTAAERSIAASDFNGKAIVAPVAKGEYAIILSPSEAMKAGIWQGDDKLITISHIFGKDLVEKLGRVNRKAEKVKIPWQFENAYENRKRLAGMGIETPSELRAALREFIGLSEVPKQPDKIKEMERAMIGRRNDGLDFFPTPSAIVDSMVETADIQEGMSVLEPSAGMGHIAERIREAGVEPDVVELSNDRRELLEAKGFNVVDRDFMEFNPESGYDRILMNPPFSDRRDMAHVQHAYDLLKPGGRLVAIMGEGVFFGQDKKAVAFREWLEERGGTDEKLEEGTFKDPSLPVTTGVNARMIVVDKPEGAKFSKSPDKPSQSTTSEITAMLPGYTKSMVKAGKLEVVQSVSDLPSYLQERGTALYHAAWHGSPHDHDKFDMGKVGTGEGAQAFGYGLYFTNNKEIAEFYRKGVSANKFMEIARDSYSEYDSHNDAYDELIRNPELSDQQKELIAALKEDDWLGFDYPHQAIREVLGKNAENWEISKRTKDAIASIGRLYQVELAPKPDEYLDWDKPLGGQSQLVKDIFKSSGLTKEYNSNLTDFATPMLTRGREKRGKNFHAYLEYKLGSDKAVSEYLHGLGIRGIRYKADGGTSKDYNYVIFSDDDVSITAKFSKLSGVEGLYDTKNDKIYLVADMLNNGNLKAVLNHELFHRSLQTDKATKAAYDKFNTTLKSRFDLASKGLASKEENAAYKRVIGSETPKENWIEEFSAYQITAFNTKPESLPSAVIKAIKEFIAAIRAALIRVGVPLSELTAADLNALAQYGARVSAQPQSSQANAMASAKSDRFYSALKRAFIAAPDKIFGNGKQLALWVQGNAAKLGVKQDEIFWSGLLDYLNMSGKVTRDDVLQYLDGNGVQVETVELSDARMPDPDSIFVVEENSQFRLASNDPNTGSLIYYGRPYDDSISAQNAINKIETKATKYQQYTVPGGKNYREMLLTLPPNKDSTKSKWRVMRPNGSVYETFDSKSDAEEIISFSPAGYELRELPNQVDPGYKSSHWDQPNIIAHIRTDERTDSNGDNLLFLNEIQSDYGQEGKKKGFKKEIKWTAKKRDGIEYEVYKDGQLIDIVQAGSEKQAVEMFNHYRGEGLEPAPFVTDTKAWINLALKHAISQALDSNINKIAIISGEQAADLYDLAKQVDSIKATKMNNGYIVEAYKDNNRVLKKDVFKDKELEDIVGKDLASKIVEQEVKTPVIYKGQDLKVGGSGMKAFYDSIVPSVARDIAKRMGGDFTTVKIPVTESKGDSYDDLASEIANPKRVMMEQNAIIITPKMREKILNEGMPLFSKKEDAANGRYNFTKENNKTYQDTSGRENYEGSNRKNKEKYRLGTKQENAEHIKNLRSYGAEIEGNTITLYRGGNVSKSVLKDLRYGDYLSATKNGLDATGNEGAAGYGKNVVKFELNVNDIIVTGAGEYQYKGQSSSLKGGSKYHPKIYKAYNDAYGSNYTANEIDEQDNVRIVASQALSGGRDEFDELMRSMNQQEILDSSSGNIRYSRASEIKDAAIDFVTGRDRGVIGLTDLDKMLATGKMPKEKTDMQAILDKAATMLVDSSRPFDAWTRKLPINAGKLIFAKDRAKRRTAEFEKQALDKFLHPLAEIVGDIAKKHKMEYRAANELTGRWMTVRYAIEKNADFLRQDKAALNKAKRDLNEKLDEDKRNLAMGVIESEPANTGLKNAVDRAQEQYDKRFKAINEQRLIDSTLEQLDAGLAGGYNDYTAKHYMDAIEEKIGRATLDRASKHVYDMLKWKLSKDLENGKVTQEMVDTWFNSPHYVPLTGDPNADEGDDSLFSHGSLNQQSDKRAVGRSGSFAINGIDAATEATQKSARYHGWVDFKDALTETYDELIQQERDNGLNEREAIRAVSDQYGIDRTPESGITRPSDSGIIVRKNGRNWVYDINDTEAVDALRSVNREDIPSVLQPIAWFTRNYSRLVTQFMPGFGPINMIRDTLERSENIRARVLPGYESIDMNKVGRKALKTAANPKLVKKILGVMLEGTKIEGKVSINNSDPDIKLLREMIAEGGTSTVGAYLSSTSGDLAKQMKDSLKLTTQTMDIVSAYNNSFELVSSFSVYKALRDSGVDKKTAASGVLNLMNFSKHGTIIGPMKALWVFLNPTMQGGHQLIQTLSTKQGKARAAAYFVIGVALYTMLRAGDDDDELGANRMDELGNFVLERNIPIPVGDGTYIKAPVGFGMQQMMWSTAVNTGKFLFGNQTASETGVEMLKSWTRTLAPIAPSETSIAAHPLVWATQTFTPQVIKPFVNVAMDVNTFGSPLTSKFEKEGVAHALQGKKTTAQEYKDIAKELSQLGFDLYPEQVREIMRGYMIGPMNEIIKTTIENPNKIALGKDYPPQLLDRIIAKSDDKELKERLFYRELDKINEAAALESIDGELSEEDKKLADIAPIIKKLQNSSNGKLAAASKADKANQPGKAKLYRIEAEALRNKAMNQVLKQRKLLLGDK